MMMVRFALLQRYQLSRICYAFMSLKLLLLFGLTDASKAIIVGCYTWVRRMLTTCCNTLDYVVLGVVH